MPAVPPPLGLLRPRPTVLAVPLRLAGSLIVAVLIVASVHRDADLRAVADRLRDAARAGGCDQPLVEMRSDGTSVEVTVRCSPPPS